MLFIYLLYIYSGIFLLYSFIYLYLFIFIYLSIYLFIYLLYLFIHLFIYMYLFVLYIFIDLFIYLSLLLYSWLMYQCMLYMILNDTLQRHPPRHLSGISTTATLSRDTLRHLGSIQFPSRINFHYNLYLHLSSGQHNPPKW